MQYPEITQTLIVIALTLGAVRIFYLSKMLRESKLDNVSNLMGMNTWKDAHRRCEEARDRSAELLRSCEEARYSLRDQNQAQMNIIDDLQSQIQQISASYTIEKRVAQRLSSMNDKINEARGNGAWELSRDQVLGEQIDNVYNLSELNRLARFMSINIENVPGETLTHKCIEFVTYVRKRNRLEELLSNLRSERGHLKWEW